MKTYKINRVFYSLGVIALGVVLLLEPDASLTWVARGIGAFVLAGGIITAVSALKNRTVLTGFFLVLAVIMVFLSLWILSNPYRLASLVPTLLGIFIFLSGLMNVGESVVVGRMKGRWLSSLLMGLITAALGVWIITRAFGIASFITRLGGGALIFDGLTDLLIAWRMKPSQAAAQNGPIDVESYEVDVQTVQENGEAVPEDSSGPEGPDDPDIQGTPEIPGIPEMHGQDADAKETSAEAGADAVEAVMEAEIAAEVQLLNNDID